MARELYQGLISVPGVGEATQWRAYRYGVRARDWELLARLALLPNLIPAIDDELGALEAAKVQAAWLSRPGRDKSALVARVRNETRVTVLNACAAASGQDPDLYDAVVDATLAPAVLLTVVENRDTPASTRARAAAKLGPRAQFLNRREWRRLQGVAEAFAEMHDPLAATTTRLELLITLSGSPELSDATLRRQATWVVDSLTELLRAEERGQASMSGWNKLHSLVTLATNLGQHPAMDPSVTATLISALVAVQQACGATPSGQTRANWVADALTKLRQASSNPLDADTMQQARTSDDPELLETATKAALNHKSRLLAGALCQNANLSVSQFRRLLDLVGWQAYQLLLTQNHHDVSKLAALLVRWPQRCSDRLLTRSGDPVAALTAVVQAFTQAGRRIPDVVAQSAYMTPGIVKLLPTAFFGEGTPPAILAVLDTTFEETLGDDKAAWDAVEAMWSGFSRTLGELLDIVLCTASEPQRVARPAA